MNLVIRAIALAGEPLTQAITGYFDERGGTLGRSDSNTMALPDPKRHISRVQASISHADGGYAITNVGSANPITLNDRPVSPGETAPLTEGDQLQVGPYVLEISLVRGNETVRTITRGRAAVDARGVIASSAGEGKTDLRRRARASADPFSAPGGAGSAGNPFADLLGTPAPPAKAAPAAKAPEPPARLPDDFDPFADLAPARAAPPAPDELPDDFDLPGASQSPSAKTLDALFDLVGDKAGRDPLADFLDPAAGTAGAAGGGAQSLDPLSLLGHGTAARQEAQPALPDDTPELRGAFAPPRVQSPAPPPREREPHPPAERSPHPPSERQPHPAPERAPHAPPERPPHSKPPASARAAQSADTDALWSAFCHAAGISLDSRQALTPELMRVIGGLLRAAIEGSLKLVAARAATKQELHAELTRIQARNNNPLKFTPDAQTALEQLLSPPLRGFLPAPAAMHDAMDDLLGHAVGTMAGMRAALDGVLARFSPAPLEARLAERTVLDSLLPMNRRAKLWELYLKHFDEVQNDARDDFHSLFGKAFLAAYEEQLDRLDAERR